MKITKITDKMLDVYGQYCTDSYDPNDCEHDCKKTVWDGNKSTSSCKKCDIGNGHWSDSN